MMTRYFRPQLALSLAAMLALCAPIRSLAQVQPAVSQPSYSDLADLADSAPLVLKALIRKVAVVEPERAQNLAPGHARLYIEAEPLAVIAGTTPTPPALAPTVQYLVDVPLDSRGKPPALKKAVVILFARAVFAGGGHGDTSELQLVAPDAEYVWDTGLEARLRGVLAELMAPGAPAKVTAVSELSYVPGALVGEGETQIFLSTANGTPASIAVEHKQGQPVRWSVSFSEVVSASGLPPAKDTLAWYRLACFLPDAVSAAANISDSDAAKAQAATDYAIVRAELGPCGRSHN